MRSIRIPNPRLSNNEKTFLDADYSTGTALTVISSAFFAANNYAVIGEVGEEKTEQSKVSAIPSSTGLTIGTAYNLTHNKTTPVYQSVWNQIILEYNDNAGSGWVAITAFDIQWDKLETLYLHSAGGDAYSYRFRFYNSANVVYSEYSPTVSGAGFGPLQVGAMVISVRKKIRDVNRQRYTDTDIIDLLQAGQDQVQIEIPKLWCAKTDTFETGTGIAGTASEDTYSLATYTDLLYLSKIRYKYVSGSTTQLWDLKGKSEDEFDVYQVQQNVRLDDNVRYVKLLPPTASNTKGSFKVFPIQKTSSVGTYYPVYYRKLTTLNTIDDTTELPFPQVLEDYAAWRLHQLMGNKAQAEIFKNLYSGPDNSDRGREPLTGIALLKMHNANAEKISSGQPKSLWNFRGRTKGALYNGMNHDYIKENYID